LSQRSKTARVNKLYKAIQWKRRFNAETEQTYAAFSHAIAVIIAVILWSVGWIFSRTGSNRKRVEKEKKMHL
jgi:hypothetical protein